MTIQNLALSGLKFESLTHLISISFQVDKDTIKVEKWFGKSKEIAAVRTVCSHIENLFKGVMKVNYALCFN